VKEGIKQLKRGQSPESPDLRDRMVKEMEREILEE